MKNILGYRKLCLMALVASALAVNAAENVAVKASRCFESDTLTALFDGKVPVSSSDNRIPRMTFWAKSNEVARTGQQWIEFSFPTPRKVAAVRVYWFDDYSIGRGHCALPAEWKVQCRSLSDASWRPIEGAKYTTVRDDFSNAVFPQPLTAQAFRIELTCANELSAGVLEIECPAEKPVVREPKPEAKRPANAALAPNMLEPLPLGAVMPRGWLKHHLELMTEGLVGRLYEHSEFLKPDNAWIDRKGKVGWEEQAYWLRSFVKVAVLTKNPRCLKVSKEWVEKILANRDPDGWYGPQPLKEHRFGDGTVLSDVWGHMVMCEALWSWWEYSHDERVFKLLDDFMHYLARTNPANLIAPKKWPSAKDGFRWQYTIQLERAGDLFPCIFKVWEVTKDSRLLDLADRLRNKLLPPGRLWAHEHNVTFSQRFAYETIYSRLSGDAADRGFADYWYDLHMAEWGQMPRGAFASDERCRVGATDPRYGTETCTWGEFTRSFQLLGDLTGDGKWADRNEDIVFNHAPVAYTPDWKALHYLTAPNQVMLDAHTDHNYYNGPPQVAYSSERYRCCRHNAAMTFPIFTENLVKRSADGALVFWMYAPHEGTTVIDGNKIAWSLDTCYPFRETAKLVVTCEKPLKARFRVPGWATGFTVGKDSAAKGAKQLEVQLPAGRSELAVAMKAECKFTRWARNGGVTVDRGPLSYSLAIGEEYKNSKCQAGPGGSSVWQEKPAHFSGALTEVLPTTPWNYALDTVKPMEYRECKWNEDCFFARNAPCEIFVSGRRLAEWTLQDNQPAELQRSPAYTTAPLERLRFVPLGCQRVRLSVLPRGTDDPVTGVEWKKVPGATSRSSRQRCTPN